MSFSAACDDWQVREAPDRGRFAEIYVALACARRRVESEPAKLQSMVKSMARSCERIFVIGDGPLQEWSELVDSENSAVEVICISGESVKVRPPKLRMKSLAASRKQAVEKGAKQ